MIKATSSEFIILPRGGGALQDVGEKSSPNPICAGTGNLTIPIFLPPGLNDFQPQLNFVYSTGNDPYGLGWNLRIPDASRNTSKGISNYDEAKDVFILSGAENLVSVETIGTSVRYRLQTEGLFSKILFHRDAANSYCEIHSKGGLKSFYGTEASFGKTDPTTTADPLNCTKISAWKLTRTEDAFNNLVEYEYERDSAEVGPRHWNQPSYDDAGVRKFLVSVNFEYLERDNAEGSELDSFSEYQTAFEIRTRNRCTQAIFSIHTDKDQDVRSYDFIYLDQRREGLISTLPVKYVSIFSQKRVAGHEGNDIETLPPLEFKYTLFESEKRSLFPLEGSNLPARSLASQDLELVDLFGNGLPNFVERNGTTLYCRKLGNGQCDLPGFINDVPSGFALTDVGVEFIDANGDGRVYPLATTAAMPGHYSCSFGGRLVGNSFRCYVQVPSFNLEESDIKIDQSGWRWRNECYSLRKAAGMFFQ